MKKREKNNFFVGELPQKLTMKETEELYMRLKNGDKNAREKLINGTVERVINLVNKIENITFWEKEELISMCIINLIKMLDTCNYDGKTIYSAITVHMSRIISKYLELKEERDEYIVDVLSNPHLYQVSGPDERYEKKELCEIIKIAIEGLPEGDKVILTEYYINGTSGMRIAEKLGRTPQHVFYVIKKNDKVLKKLSKMSIQELNEIKRNREKIEFEKVDTNDLIVFNIFELDKNDLLLINNEQKQFELYKKGNKEARDNLILINAKKLMSATEKLPKLAEEDQKEFISTCLLEITRIVNGYRGKTLDGLHKIMNEKVMQKIKQQFTEYRLYNSLFQVVENPLEERNCYINPVSSVEDKEISKIIEVTIQEYLVKHFKLKLEMAQEISRRIIKGEKINKIFSSIEDSDYAIVGRSLRIKQGIAKTSAELLQEIDSELYSTPKILEYTLKRK